MHKKKHKRKVSRVIIFTTDAVDAKMKQLKIRPWAGNIMMLVFCILIGSIIGYGVYQRNGRALLSAADTIEEKDMAILLEENIQLQSQVEVLEDKLDVLSQTVNQKAQDAQELEQMLLEQSMPTGFPLTGSASMEEFLEGDPLCVFTAEEDILVVATASGTVSSIEEDAEYGHKITVDHGNGYKTIYRNQGDTKVNIGDSVVKGTTLYIIGTENTRLGYQMMKDDAYINPMEVLSISG